MYIWAVSTMQNAIGGWLCKIIRGKKTLRLLRHGTMRNVYEAL